LKDFIPFAVPDIDDDEINEVIDSLRSGWLTTGPKTKRFEDEFASFISEGIHAIAVNSGTAGLHLALEAVGVGPGDEVITTCYTFTATAEVVRYLGADPVFVDIDPTTLNIDITQIEAAITKRTKAIVPVHFAGLACDMAAILALARKYDLRVIDDAAHAFPTASNGTLIGAQGSDATVYSFYATKTLTTGEGGMIVTQDPEIYERCKILRLHGIDRDSFARNSNSRSSWQYEVVAPGFKYNMTDLASAIGIQQLKKAWRFQSLRNKMAETYSDALSALPIVLPPNALSGDNHAWHLYVIRLR